MAQKSYESNGVSLSKKTLNSGDRIKVSYNGLLVQSGAQSLFLHVGYGDEWEDKLLIPMEYSEGVFTAEIEIQDFKSLGICFKDAAENWDNNSGENYVFSISKKPVKKEKAADVNVIEKGRRSVKVKIM
jgi:hypothetical protein